MALRAVGLPYEYITNDRPPHLNTRNGRLISHLRIGVIRGTEPARGIQFARSAARQKNLDHVVTANARNYALKEEPFDRPCPTTSMRPRMFQGIKWPHFMRFRSKLAAGPSCHVIVNGTVSQPVSAIV